MKKKIFALMLVFVLIISVGCSNDSNVNNETEVVSTEEPQNQDSETKGTLIAGTEGTMIPWTYMDGDEVVGFEADMMKEVSKRTGYEIEMKPIEWAGLFGSLDSDRIDLVANIVTINEERQEKYEFTEPFLYNPMVIATQADSEITSLEEVDGMSIVVEAGSSDEQVVDALEEKYGITLERTYYQGISINDVELGRVDLWIGSAPSIAANIEAGYKLKVIDKTGEYQEYGYPFLKGEEGEKLRDEFDLALKSMREDGTLSEISQKWLVEDYTNTPQ